MRTKNTAVAFALFSLVILLTMPFLASAQQTPPNEGLTIERIVTILKRFISWIFTVLLIIAVIFIIWAAFKYLTGQGDPGAAADASRALIYAAVAIAVGLLSVGFIALVGQLVGVNGGGWNPFGATGSTGGSYPSPSSEQIPYGYPAPYAYPDPSSENF